MDCDGKLKSKSHLFSMCCSSPLNLQLLLYDGYDIHFDDRSLNILWSQHIQYFILNLGDSINDQTNNNGTNLKLDNMYGNKRIKWTSNHGTLKLMSAYINAVL